MARRQKRSKTKDSRRATYQYNPTLFDARDTQPLRNLEDVRHVRTDSSRAQEVMRWHSETGFRSVARSNPLASSCFFATYSIGLTLLIEVIYVQSKSVANAASWL